MPVRAAHSAKNFFSAMRFCAIDTQLARGATNAPSCSSLSSACAGTFSNSVVTAGHSAAISASAASSV